MFGLHSLYCCNTSSGPHSSSLVSNQNFQLFVTMILWSLTVGWTQNDCQLIQRHHKMSAETEIPSLWTCGASICYSPSHCAYWWWSIWNLMWRSKAVTSYWYFTRHRGELKSLFHSIYCYLSRNSICSATICRTISVWSSKRECSRLSHWKKFPKNSRTSKRDENTTNIWWRIGSIPKRVDRVKFGVEEIRKEIWGGFNRSILMKPMFHLFAIHDVHRSDQLIDSNKNAILSNDSDSWWCSIISTKMRKIQWQRLRRSNSGLSISFILEISDFPPKSVKTQKHQLVSTMMIRALLYQYQTPSPKFLGFDIIRRIQRDRISVHISNARRWVPRPETRLSPLSLTSDLVR